MPNTNRCAEKTSAEESQLSEHGVLSRASELPHATGNENDRLAEGITSVIGGDGLHQRLQLLFQMCLFFLMALHDVLDLAIAMPVDHWCKLPMMAGDNMTLEIWKARFIPVETDGSYSQCTIYEESAEKNTTNKTVPCSSWQYNSSGKGRSIIQEWELVCDQEWLLLVSSSFSMSGGVIGVLISGVASDRVGRRPAICFSSLVLQAFGMGMANSRNIYMFAFHRFFVFGALSAVTFTSFVLLIEIVTSQNRALYGMLAPCGFILGVLAIEAVRKLKWDWSAVNLFVAVINFSTLLSLVLLFESPRWLIARYDVRGALNVICSLRYINGKKDIGRTHLLSQVLSYLPETPQDKSPSHSPYSSGLRDVPKREVVDISNSRLIDIIFLLMTKELRFSIFAVTTCWFTAILIYFSVHFSTRIQISGVDYFTMILLMAAVPLGYISVVKFGRRKPCASSFLLCGVACLLSAFTADDFPETTEVVLGFGSFCIIMAIHILFFYSMEIFPTSIRSFSFSVGASAGHLSLLLSPFHLKFVKSFGKFLGYLSLASLCFLSGILAGYLPETACARLSEVVKNEKRDLFEFAPLQSSRNKRQVVVTSRKKGTEGSVKALDTGPLNPIQDTSEISNPPLPHLSSTPESASPSNDDSPPKTSSPPKSDSPPKLRSPPKLGSPPKSNSPPKSHSPPNLNAPPNSNSQPKSGSPPKSISSTKSNSPPKAISSLKSKSPPKWKSSPKSISPTKPSSSTKSPVPPSTRDQKKDS